MSSTTPRPQSIPSSMTGSPTTPIRDYGLIGDMSSAALVSIDGSIDWCCFPRFDSPSVFAAILDPNVGGRFRIAPAAPCPPGRQGYLSDSNVLKTLFTIPTGQVSVTDFMPVDADDAPHEIHRIVRCESGEVDVECTFQPRMDYARGATVFRRLRQGVQARGGHQTMSLLSDVPLEISEDGARSRFKLAQGETATFVLAYGRNRPQALTTYRTDEKLRDTLGYWRRRVSGIVYDGLWRDAVVRSILVLHLMTYRRTGAIVAAPTTSLPEVLGGSRNWDYRFAWLRDSSFTVDILYRMGDVDEGDRYVTWLLDQCKLNSRKTRIVYGVSPKSSLKEHVLQHMGGHAGSAPVRIGNGAARHLQLDVFGEVILAIHSLHRLRREIPSGAWSLVANFAETVVANWHRRDRGVWEVRGKQSHFVYSKIMCWAALDRAAEIALIVGNRRMADRWSRTAGRIRFEILHSGWSAAKQGFRQRYDADTLDASNLVIPFLKFLPPNDPRILRNVRAIERELADGPFVWRYLPSETDDGLGGQHEGAFVLLSFWLIGNLLYTGQVERAAAYLEELMTKANHLGLFAEMIDPRTGDFLGNFPQAYSHVGLIHTARNLSRTMAGQPLTDGRTEHETARV